MYNDYSILQSAGINKEVECESINYAFDKGEHVFKPVDAVYGSLISRNGAYLSLPTSSVSGNGSIMTQYVDTGDINTDGQTTAQDASLVLHMLQVRLPLTTMLRKLLM